MHFTGQIWRPPYEANSVLLQVTAGCTHSKCKFCSLYDVSFRMSPLSEIEEDLQELHRSTPWAKKVFLTGASPFVLSFDKLKTIALKIKEYLPKCENISTFTRISDIAPKSIDQLKELHSLGFNGISIGTETGDDETLAYMNKGNTAADTLEQCKKLEEAGIEYYIIYLTGLAGHKKGEHNALASAKLFSQLKPYIISVVSLTITQESELYTEIQKGSYVASGERERLSEERIFIENLKNTCILFASHETNTAPMTGMLPKDKMEMIQQLKYMIDHVDEAELKAYREGIKLY
jgi:radical SAM superfamily enzyme YgiQ (UPF0313 family)